MEDSHSGSTSPLSSQLLCQETETRLNEEEYLDENTFINSSNYTVSDTEEEEYIQLLLDREINIGLQRHDSSDNWIKCARLDAIAWILKTRASFGFRFQTAYLSVTYFDRFLSRRVIGPEKYWATQLLSAACMSLAAKMEECRAPALSEFQVEDYNFESKVIQRMELLVLNTLEWRMSSVTPFAYIHYFLRKFYKDASPSRNIVPRTVQLVLGIMRDVNLMDHRPSVIAGAATLAALDRKLTRQALEIKINAFSPCGFLEIEEVFSCYNRIQELEMERLLILPNCPTLRETDVSENNSSVTSSLSTKRKRLTFHNCDQNYGIPNEKRHR